VLVCLSVKVIETMSTQADFNKLKVADLRQELTARGLDTKGNKPDLVARLAAALNATSATTSTPAPTTEPTTSAAPAQPQTPQLTEPKQATTRVPPPTSVAPVAPQLQPSAHTPAPTNQDRGGDGGGDDQGGEEVDITQMSDAERKRARAERFGIPLQQTEADKKSQRAARFGIGQSGSLSQSGGLSKSGELKVLADSDRVDTRKKRFGVVESSPRDSRKSGHHASVNVPKAQRLGIPVKVAGSNDAKKQARLARFGGTMAQSQVSNEDEEKKKKRAERFDGSVGDAGKRLRVDKPLEQQTI